MVNCIDCILQLATRIKLDRHHSIKSMSASATLANPLDEPSVLSSPSNSGRRNAVRERNSLSLEQRRALRRWANSQSVRPSHKSCIEWFATQYGQTISQSTVSHSLSPKYARLDGDPQLSGSRLRFGNWPDVEKLVLMWYHSMVNSGRHPTNEELAEKAKSIFQQLPRYKDESPPEFSPGWIHRFKKRYGLLVRRQRRHGSGPPPQDDIPYLVDTIPRFMNISPETSPAAIRESVNRIVGVEPSLATCARVRDEIVRRLETPQLHPNGQPHVDPASDNSAAAVAVAAAAATATAAANNNNNSSSSNAGAHINGGASDAYGEEDPEVMLQNALHALQQEEADAEAQAAADREVRDRLERGLPPAVSSSMGHTYAQQAAGAALATPVRNSSGGGGGGGTAATAATGSSSQPHANARFSATGDELNLTPINANGPTSSTDRPMRCPFCINQRMLRTIKEAVEHMATHVVV